MSEMLKGQAGRYDAHPDSKKTPLTIANNTAGMDMKITAPANGSYLNKAVAHLNKETQRGEYDPMPRTMGTPRDPLTMK